ncbi:MAG: hypothetical protein RIC19_18525 [Phaeodactylibacter sp.]|uniref:hypothetical protein n=1 Tax=Phaeodactylibacter sp. TaxID=1940289 RepID=UPI0032ED59CF
MSKNYHFKFNPEQPAKADIEQQRDFDALMKQYQAAKRAQRSAKIRHLAFRSLSAAAAVALLIFGVRAVFFSGETTPPISNTAFLKQQPYIDQPIQSLSAPTFANFRVNTAKGGVYEYPSGSKLVVPAAAFANDYGQLIGGEVDVFYREMHDYVDFFTSGIPMRYDSAGNAFQLESAGMIELYAEQNGQRVQLAVGKKIDIELASEIMIRTDRLNEPPSYNVYYLDTLINQWRYQDADQLQLLETGQVIGGDPHKVEKTDLLEALRVIDIRKESRLSALESSVPMPVKPLRPIQASGDRPTLELNFLDGSVQVEDAQNGQVESELAQLQQMYQNVIWQISEDSPAYDQRAFAVEWESVSIRPINNRDYELTLIHPKNQVTLIVSPVLMGEDFQKALDRYAEELVAYQKTMASREARLGEEREAILQTAEAEKQAAIAQYDENVAPEEGAADLRYLVRRKVMNRFKADKLGVWNCARPVPVNAQPLKAKYKDQYGNTYQEDKMYLVDKSKNTVYQFYSGSEVIEGLNPNADNLIWVVTPDDQIAVLRTGQLRRINQQPGQSTTLELQVLGQPADAREAREMLQF